MPDKEELRRFIRLGLFQGIPYAFKDKPMLFEHVRDYLAGRLDLEPEQVSMRGSGRIGFSLAPLKDFSVYEPEASDLDLFVVSDKLFDRLVAESNAGLEMWRAGKLEPSDWLAKRWAENEITTARHIYRQFFDTNKVLHYRPIYVPRTKLRCDVTINALNTKLKDNWGFRPRAVKFLRVYRNWDAAMNQNLINLEKAFEQ